MVHSTCYSSFLCRLNIIIPCSPKLVIFSGKKSRLIWHRRDDWTYACSLIICYQCLTCCRISVLFWICRINWPDELGLKEDLNDCCSPCLFIIRSFSCTAWLDLTSSLAEIFWCVDTLSCWDNEGRDGRTNPLACLDLSCSNCGSFFKLLLWTSSFVSLEDFFPVVYPRHHCSDQ